MKDTIINGKKINMYYQTILNKNRFNKKSYLNRSISPLPKAVPAFRQGIRLLGPRPRSYQLYIKDSLKFPYRLGLIKVALFFKTLYPPKAGGGSYQQKYYHISNIRAVNRIGPHNEDILSVIIGSLLGDASSLYKGRAIKKTFSTLIKIPLNPN